VVDWDRYATAWADQHGGYDQRRAPAPVRGWLRLGYRMALLLAALRVPPAAVTAAELAFALGVPLVAGRGQLGQLAGAGLVLLSSLAGVVGRAMRVLTGRAGPGTAIGEAVTTRLSEVAWLAGFWALGVPGLLVVACGGLSGLYEYVRTQALSAGMSPIGTQTLAEHSMRVSVSAVGLALAGLAGLAGRPIGSGLLAIAALVWLLLTTHGLAQLTGALRRSVRGAG
jgi:hypothetical protein